MSKKGKENYKYGERRIVKTIKVEKIMYIKVQIFKRGE